MPNRSRRTRRGRGRRQNNNTNTNPNRNRAQTNGRFRGPNGPSHVDNWAQTRTITTAATVRVTNTSGNVAYGIGNWKVVPSTNHSPYVKQLLEESSQMYEQYILRRIRIYATPGAYFTNDMRIKAKVLSRVDRDGFIPSTSPTALGQLASGSNTVMHMLPDASKRLVADFQPVCKPYLPGMSISDGRQLPNTMCWMAMRDNNSNIRFNYDEWYGAQVALLLPDESIPVQQAPTLNLSIRIDVQFRGRLYHNASYSVADLTNPNPYPVNDTFDHLRTNLLNGTYFPLDGFGSINIANIGTDLSIDCVGCKYRVQSSQTVYLIMTWNNDTLTYAAQDDAVFALNVSV